MKLLKINLLGILLTLSYSVFCQSVYRSSTFESAVTNKTRTLTGLPGEKYVNNFAEYKITATFNPQTHILEGEEFVTYHANMDGYYNDRIYMNLYRNIYKKGALRTRPCSPDDITDEGMEILEIKRVTKSGGQDDVFFYVSNTSLVIAPGKFSKGDKVTLYVRWRNKIAANTKHRGGKYNDNSWFIPYWYPQIAVFDDVYGWDNIAHTGNEEFLFEFANYDVNITVGEKMYVWATGELLNKTDIYSKNVLDLYAKAQKSDSEISIVNSANREAGLKKAENTWHFKADSVPDFAFCCSSDADWTGSSVQLTKNQKRTFTSAVHHSKGFSYVIPMTKKTLAYLSTQRPGVPYPYPHLTIFEGGGGMEFPMMVNEDFDNEYDSDFFTTSHEVTHSYFPFLTGMYQNRYAFMDEGLAMYVPQNFQNSEFKTRNITEDAARCVNYVQSSDNYVPMATPSYSQTHLWIYTVNSYYKPQMAYTFLEEIVGDRVMEKILNVFTQSWRGKHPLPYDFFNLCENLSGLNLKDYFHSWFYSVSLPDLSVAQVKDKTITIQNPGGLMLPVYLKVKYKDGSVEIIERNALCWAGGNNSVNMTVNKEIDAVELGNSTIPDINRTNNSWYAE